MDANSERDAIRSVYSTDFTAGDVCYIINAKWWSQWKDYVNWDEAMDAMDVEGQDTLDVSSESKYSTNANGKSSII